MDPDDDRYLDHWRVRRRRLPRELLMTAVLAAIALVAAIALICIVPESGSQFIR